MTGLPERTEVLVVGAGLAGLRCAVRLQEAGLDVTVIDAGDEVGGRIRTERVEGHLLDRGFQLLNPAYPAVRRWVDVAALRLGTFEAGVAAVDNAPDTAPTTAPGTAPGGGEHLVRLGHPWHAPRLLGATLAALRHEPLAAAGLLRWAAPLLPVPGVRPRAELDRRLAGRDDQSLAASFDAAGVHGLPRRVLEAFLSGVLLDDTGATSAHLVRLLVASFVAGTPGLPAAGMQALPEQLARRLERPPHVGVRARQLHHRAPHLVDTTHGAILAEAVVVAADPHGAADLLGLRAPTMRGVVTDWWTTTTPPAPPGRRRLLHVDARDHSRTGGRRIVANVAVVSAAAPTYAPEGRHLVAASVVTGSGAALGGRPDSETPSPHAVRREAAHLLGCAPGDWTHLRRHHVSAALPAQRPPLDSRAGVDLGEGLFVAGDHVDTASIQGALVSGERAASAVLSHRARR